MSKASLVRALETIRVFERGALSLTNALMVFISVLLLFSSDWGLIIAFGLTLLSYNFKRYLNHVREMRESALIRREKAKEIREAEDYKNLKEQVSAIQTKLTLMNRGF